MALEPGHCDMVVGLLLFQIASMMLVCPDPLRQSFKWHVARSVRWCHDMHPAPRGQHRCEHLLEEASAIMPSSCASRL